jgi:hypothetical protein
MKGMTLALAAAATLLGGAANAENVLNPSITQLCLDVSGRQLPVSCRSEASRIQHREDICQCLHGGRQVDVAICPEGVRPPPESAPYERARYAAIQHGSLVGATWQGRPICVAPVDPLTGSTRY